MKLIDRCEKPEELLVALIDRIRRLHKDKLAAWTDWELHNAEDMLRDVIIEAGIVTAKQIADEEARVQMLKHPHD